MAPVNRTEMLRTRSAQFRREILQAINGVQAVRDGLGQIQLALLDTQNAADLATLIRLYNGIDRTFTSVVSQIEEISRGARDSRMSFRRVQFNVRRLVRERANVTFTPRPRPVRNATRPARIPGANFNNTIFGIINRIPAAGQQELLRSVQTQTRLSFGEVRLLINPVISMIRVVRAPVPTGPRIMPVRPAIVRDRVRTNPVGRPVGRPARAMGDDGEFFGEELPAEAFTDDEAAFAEADPEDALIDEELALDEEITASAVGEDDGDSSDFAVVEEESGSFDSVEEIPSFAIEESGDFAAIEEEAAAFALDENLESAAAVEDENLQFFSEDVVAAAVEEDPAAAFSENEQYLAEDISLAVEDVAGDVAVADETITTFDDQLPGDLAVADEADLAVSDEADLAVADDADLAVFDDSDLAFDDQLPGDLAVAEDEQFLDFPVDDRDMAVADTIEVENLALDEADAAEAATDAPTSLTQPASTALPSWGIALIVIGVFVAIACILVVIQLFIYFRSA
jgi:hypothetical protein